MRVIPVLLCVILVATACVGLRWIRMDSSGGRQFGPWPDGLEYACGAQSIRDSGTYYLQVGPHVVKPRYPPGWSLLMVPFLSAGLPAEQICFVPAIFDAAHALLLAAFVFLLLTRVLDAGGASSDTRRFWIALAAALTVGLGWSCTPMSVDHGRRVVSDPAVALLTDLAIAAILWAAIRGWKADRRGNGLLVLAGFAAGVAAATRPITGALLCVPIAMLVSHLAMTRGLWAGCRGAAWLLLGVLVPAAGTSWLMARSGYAWWEWSAYEFWVPQIYADIGTTFRLDYAFGAGHETAAHARHGDGRLANGTFGLATLLGLPLASATGLGSYWPILAWSLGGGLLWRLRRQGRFAWLVVVGLAAWPVGHLVVFSLYIYTSGRFYLGVASWPWVLLAVATGWWCLRSRRPGRELFVTAIVLGLVFLSARSGVRRIPWTWTPDYKVWFDKTRANFEPWQRRTDSERSELVAPIHPLVAQALGWLPRDTVAGIGAWGRLDASIEHVRRLVDLGVIPRGETSLPKK